MPRWSSGVQLRTMRCWTIVKNSLNRASPTPVSVPPTATTTAPPVAEVNGSRPTFKPVTVLEDLQAVRCAEFHPNGKLYAVGSNTKNLRICTYPKLSDVKDGNKYQEALSVLGRGLEIFRRLPACGVYGGFNQGSHKAGRSHKIEKFSFYKLVELAMHDGTVRDVCFIEDTSNKASLLVSGGAGDCKIYVTDCATGKPFQVPTRFRKGTSKYWLYQGCGMGLIKRLRVTQRAMERAMLGVST
ncbi:jg16204 [Pararge aegeria aegeria]|uniref:Jg16204 protein n=1 Tax=Pararge aegeria aegeria TaxID=348720 RepID=A0A8S4SP62_9NEOP|nr:jg16204 [Pararge aegeria aegeria]